MSRAKNAAIAAQTMLEIEKRSYQINGKTVDLSKSLQYAITHSILYRPADFLMKDGQITLAAKKEAILNAEKELSENKVNPGEKGKKKLIEEMGQFNIDSQKMNDISSNSSSLTSTSTAYSSSSNANSNANSSSSSSITTVPPQKKYTTLLTFGLETTLQAARRLVKDPSRHVGALNFASAKHPGGGFQKGSQAQEESLARSSGLYPCIAQMTEMYRENLKSDTCAYFHYMIYSPSVPVWKDDNGNLLENPYHVSFVTAPAVNAGVVRQRIQNSQAANETIIQTMLERMDRILALFKLHQCDTIILGNYGCGVFHNDEATVAYLFHQLLESNAYKYAFTQFHFAIPDKNLEIFQKEFSRKLK